MDPEFSFVSTASLHETVRADGLAANMLLCHLKGNLGDRRIRAFFPDGFDEIPDFELVEAFDPFTSYLVGRVVHQKYRVRAANAELELRKYPN